LRGEGDIRILQKSDDSGILVEFFKNFDQNTGVKILGANTSDDLRILQES
jgi:hypothetical protein